MAPITTTCVVLRYCTLIAKRERNEVAEQNTVNLGEDGSIGVLESMTSIQTGTPAGLHVQWWLVDIGVSSAWTNCKWSGKWGLMGE